MRDPAIGRVLSALTEPGRSPRFVGGAVRDWLVGRTVSDIDVATPLHPETVMQRLEANGIRAIPTGLAHGTVTAVSGGRPLEITTLRRDLETDGRHATIAFTEDWAADAARRDFTMNALYAEPDGTVFDPTGGLADLEAGRVRFVGDPATRIREDYLRLLRFFRFYAHYGTGEADRDALQAAETLASGLSRLSVERIWTEMKKLLAAPDPSPSVALMARHNVLAHAAAEGCDPERLRQLILLEPSYPLLMPRDALRRLAALLPAELDIEGFAEHWRLSREESNRLSGIRHAADHATGALPRPWPLLRRHGADTLVDGALVAASRGEHAALTLLPVAAFWNNPEFPIRGADLLALGYAPGPALGEALAAVEQWWEEGGCIADRSACLEFLKGLPGA
jgi:poly(A) polymerase